MSDIKAEYNFECPKCKGRFVGLCDPGGKVAHTGPMTVTCPRPECGHTWEITRLPKPILGFRLA